MLAPIVVFAYNRPKHLQDCLRALSLNDHAEESVLYIFCDGAKSNASKEEKSNIEECANVAYTTKGFKEVNVITSTQNKGLADSIISGVSHIIEKYGRVIVLEDDLITSQYFLSYMNAALDYYHNRPSVMSISANRPPKDKMEIPSDYPYDVFVSLRPFSTGWGTWESRWSRIDWSMDYLDEFLQHQEQIKAFNRGGEDLTQMLIDQKKGMVDSWAIRFAFAHFKEHSISILPCISYIDNIGFDGSGIHSGVNCTNEFRNDLSKSVSKPVFIDNLYEDTRIINAFYNRYCSKKRPIYQRIVNTIFRLLKREAPFVLKKKVYATD